MNHPTAQTAAGRRVARYAWGYAAGFWLLVTWTARGASFALRFVSTRAYRRAEECLDEVRRNGGRS